MGRRSIEATAEVRLFPIWRRAASVHRERLRAGGSVADSGDGCTEISAAARGESPRGTTRLHHAAAAAWSVRHPGAPPCKRRSRQRDGRAICCRGLAASIVRRRRQAPEGANHCEWIRLAPRGYWPQLCSVLHDTQDGIARNHADEALAVENEMAAAAGPQNLGAVFLQRYQPLDSRYFMAHNIGGVEAGERLANGDLRNALLRGVKEEPAYEHPPDAGLPIPPQEKVHAGGHQSIGHKFSDRTGNLCRARMILSHSPDDGAENSAAVQGKPGNQVEECQSKIDES